MAEVMEVHPDLVSPAAVQGAFDQADVGAGTQDVIFRFRGTALAPRDAHPLPVDGVAGDGFINYAGLLAHDPRNQREINFRHRARGKLAGKIAVSGVVLRHHQSAAGLLVQTMDDSRTFLSSDAGKILAVGQQRVHQSVLLMPGARVHDNSGRLVEHEEVVVLENDIEFYLLRLRFDLLYLWFPQLNNVTRANEVAWSWRFSVEADESVPDQRLKSGPGKGGKRFRENAVEPLARLFVRDGELDHG